MRLVSSWLAGRLKSGGQSRPACRIAVAACALGFLAGPAEARSSEFRAYWADAFHNGFFSATQVNTLTNDLRAGHFNAVVVEVRKRGDAYYTPNTQYADYEPHASNTSPSTFDSLADLIAKCHDTRYGQRIEVHAWLVTYPVWNNQTTAPANPQHPYNRHPDWLMQDNTGATWDSSGGNYMFDPGHPAVQNHTFTIAMNLVTNYDLDGLNFDYVRYPGNTWGYHPVTVGRFHARFGGTGPPLPTDAKWLQFRRDQVSALVRKIYLTSISVKPWVKISADTICWAPGITTDAQWSSTSAYASVLQDWRAWMQEGILDLNLPMMYFDYSARATDWHNWSIFAKDHRYNRHLAIGLGSYLNAASNAIVEMRSTRNATSTGHRADGLCLYSYAVPSKDGITRADFHAALTAGGTSLYDSTAPGIFYETTPTPAMPWKTAPTNGHLMGFVYGGTAANPLDGATVTLTGVGSRSQTNDATGFYGFVDLAPGNYRVIGRMTGVGSATNTITIAAGVVTRSDLLIPPSAPVITAINLLSDGRIRLEVSAYPAGYAIDASADLLHWGELTNLVSTNASFQYTDGQTRQPKYFYRVRWRP